MEKYLGAFTKLNQATHPTLIADTELTELYNMVITKEGDSGIIAARSGTEKNIIIPATVNRPFLGAYEFEKSGTIVNVIVTNNNAYIYNRATETLTTLAITPNIQELDNCLRVSDNDVLLLCNKEPVIIANIFTTPVIRSLNIPAPDIANIEIEAGGASQVSSVAYVLTYYTDDGTESIPSQKFGIWTDGNIANRILRNLPVPADPRIIGKRLYRTQIQAPAATDVGGIFYHCTDIPNSVTTWQDNIPDTALNYGKILDYIAVIKSARVGAIHRNRLFLGNVTIEDFNPYKLMYFKPYSSLTTWQARKGGLLTNGVAIGFGNYVHYSLESSANGFPINTFLRYHIYLKTADGKYSDYYYVIQFESITAGNFRVSFKSSLYTGFLGAGLTPYPDFRFIEIYRCNNYSNPTTGLLIAALELTPSLLSAPPDIFDNNNTGTFVTLPTTTVQSPVTYPSGVFYSEAGELGKILTGNRFMIPEEGGQITKILSETDGIVVAKDTSRHKIFTEAPPAGWRIYKVSEIGIAHPHYASSNAGRYYFYDGKYIRTNDDSIISLEVTKSLQENIESSESSRVLVTNRYVLISGIKRNAYGVADVSLFLYDIIYGVWSRWLFSPYSQATIMVAPQNDSDYDFIPVFLSSIDNQIHIPKYTDSGYDVIGAESNVQIPTVIKTKKFKEGDYIFRLYKIIVDIELNELGNYMIEINENIIASANTSGIKKFLISDAANSKKQREFDIKIAGVSIKKIKGIKLIYNLVRGLYGE